MKGIGIDEYIELRLRDEPNINVMELRDKIYGIIRAKLEGYRCCKCQNEMWAVGAVVLENYLCLECIGINNENEIEFDIFLEKVY